MKNNNISLLEGRKVTQAIDYLVEIFKGDVFPKDLMIDILVIMRKMAMNGSMSYSTMQELLGIIEDSLEKLTCPESISGEKPRQDTKGTVKILINAAKIETPKPVVEKKPQEKFHQERNSKAQVMLEEKDMAEKNNGSKRTYAKVDSGLVCEIESRLSFPITNSRLAVLLDVLTYPDSKARDLHFDKLLIEEIEIIKKRISSQPVPFCKIVLVEKDRGISIKDEDCLYGMTFMAGESSSILVWTKDDRLCPWRSPETTPLEDLMSMEGIEATDLRCIVMVKSPIGGSMEMDFIKFVK